MLMLESNHSDTAGSDRVTVISSMGLLDWTLMTELESSPIKTDPRSRGLPNHGYQPRILNGMILQGVPALV